MSKTKLPLSGQTLLITRPAHQQGAIQQRLQELGATPLALPTLSIDALTDEDALRPAKSCVMELDTYQHVIFISTNAVEHGLALIDDYWPQLPAYQNYYAIGVATSQALHRRGLVDSGATGADEHKALMNSEGLLQHPLLQTLDLQQCLIFRGVGGREHLAEQLRLRGAKVDYAEVYRRLCPSYPHEQIIDTVSACDKVLVGSGDSLYNLCQLAEQANVLSTLVQKPVLVPSARVATLASEQGFDTVLLSENASVESCCRALIKA